MDSKKSTLIKVRSAMDIIEEARNVLLAHRLLKYHNVLCAPDLLPTVDNLLVKSGNYLHKAEKELSK